MLLRANSRKFWVGPRIAAARIPGCTEGTGNGITPVVPVKFHDNMPS